MSRCRCIACRRITPQDDGQCSLSCYKLPFTHAQRPIRDAGRARQAVGLQRSAIKRSGFDMVAWAGGKPLGRQVVILIAKAPTPGTLGMPKARKQGAERDSPRLSLMTASNAMGVTVEGR